MRTRKQLLEQIRVLEGDMLELHKERRSAHGPEQAEITDKIEQLGEMVEWLEDELDERFPDEA